MCVIYVFWAAVSALWAFLPSRLSSFCCILLFYMLLILSVSTNKMYNSLPAEIRKRTGLLIQRNVLNACLVFSLDNYCRLNGSSSLALTATSTTYRKWGNSNPTVWKPPNRSSWNMKQWSRRWALVTSSDILVMKIFLVLVQV